MNGVSNRKSSYLRHLPAMFRNSGEETATAIEKFLNIFEKFMTGIDDKEELEKILTATDEEKKIAASEGLSEVIDKLPEYFYPDSRREEFVDWLSSWVGLVLKENWPVEKKVEIVKKIVPIYRMRGTKNGLEAFLNAYVDGGVTIIDDLSPFQIESNSTVGVNTLLGGLPPYFFIVDILLAVPDPAAMGRKIVSVKKLIEIEKPAHTDYRLNIRVPAMQIELHSTVEVDTLLWEDKV